MSKKIIAVCIFLIFSLAIHAQQLGTLRGTVMDESGALVPGAKVTVSNAAGPVKSATAGNDGSYSVIGLDAGTYTVQATLPGFQQLKAASLYMRGGKQPAALDFKLAVAA